MRLRRALLSLPDGPKFSREAFVAGVKRIGFEPVLNLEAPRSGDVLLTWNRHGANNARAQAFEAVGAPVVVVENGYFGRQWMGRRWFAMARDHHAGAGRWFEAGPERWDALGVELAPWRDGGSEVVILGQRGIGEPGVASPHGWAERVQVQIGGRIRRHPGEGLAVSLADDLKDASCVVTWHSGAALHALLMGAPVFYGFPHWIGAGAARPLEQFQQGPLHGDRLAVMRRLAWAMATEEEVASGEAIERLLAC